MVRTMEMSSSNSTLAMIREKAKEFQAIKKRSESALVLADLLENYLTAPTEGLKVEILAVVQEIKHAD